MREIRAHITGSLWRLLVNVGDQVAVDDEVAILESMKLEVPVEAEISGTVAEILVSEGDPVSEDDVLIRLEAS